MGGGGSILLGGLNRLGGGLGQGASTAVAVISWPSICPVEKRSSHLNPDALGLRLREKCHPSKHPKNVLVSAKVRRFVPWPRAKL